MSALPYHLHTYCIDFSSARMPTKMPPKGPYNEKKRIFVHNPIWPLVAGPVSGLAFKRVNVNAYNNAMSYVCMTRNCRHLRPCIRQQVNQQIYANEATWHPQPPWLTTNNFIRFPVVLYDTATRTRNRGRFVDVEKIITH